MPRSRKAPAKGVGVEILAAVYRHYHADGRQFNVQDAARMLGLSWTALHDLISRGAEPKLQTARKLARFMGLTTDQLGDLYDNADLSGILSPGAPTPTPRVSAQPITPEDELDAARMDSRPAAGRKQKRK